jgi:hypothetical protein
MTRIWTRGGLAFGAGLAVVLSLVYVTPGAPPRAADTLPERLTDRAFWALVTECSEEGGYFRSDNFVSNETSFQRVVPEIARRGPGGVYLGVGPEQNFTYIVALRPKIAFIVDIRRQNLLLHLLYKALVELSADRAELLSRLFGRPRPPGLGGDASVDALFEAYARAARNPALRRQTLADVTDRLVRHHGFALAEDDLRTIEYVYDAFYNGGPELTYGYPAQYAGYGGYGGYGWRRFPTFAELAQATDARGIRHSYLASEAHYRTLRDLQLANRIVPVVGDFAGERAIRAIGRYLRKHGATVTVFYTSNVEQYLFRSDGWRNFLDNVAALPVDEHSLFVRAYFNFGGRWPRGGTPGDRSATLVSPVTRVLEAYRRGMLRSYTDLIDLSQDPSRGW